MDSVDRDLLNAVQTAFPVTSDPYAELGKLAGISETDAYQRIEQMRQDGLIRRLGGVFNSRRLGYFSTLCAAKVPEAKIPLLTELLAQHPGVTHNYLRDHAYNMWFTLIASSVPEVENTLKQWQVQTGIPHIYSLPALRMFKIRVDFDFSEVPSGSIPGSSHSERDLLSQAPADREEAPLSFSDEEKSLVRILQRDIPHDKNPFVVIASQLGRPEGDILICTHAMIDNGAIRRFGAVLRHQKAGFTANSMGVWQVPEDRAEEVGRIMASFREVSHCYQRPPLADWPYNLFTMIHGRTKEECLDAMARIAVATKISDYSMLYSIKELKKCSMEYFMENQ